MQLTFDEVHNPVRVQRDIDRHRLVRINDEKREQKEVEMERIVDWLVTYHRNAEEFRQQKQEENEPNPE